MTAQSQIVNNPSRLRAHSLGIDAPELSQYQDEPAQMHSGAVGKSGYLRLGFEKRGTRSVLAA
ncbi:MAG: urease accessory protein, partial [Pseudomonas sp.]|nr:urease accessory protein [Pseudomonas sp.]